ncbi:MAG: hypothetical protein ACE5NG_13945 [bacterium]
MKRVLTLQLPEEIILQAESLANLSGFSIDEFIEKLLQSIMKPGQSIQENRTFIQKLFSFLSDDEILLLANLKMDSKRLKLFNQLLSTQKEKQLSVRDATDLEALGLHYDRINLLKSYAMVEAVRRKLMPAPEQI